MEGSNALAADISSLLAQGERALHADGDLLTSRDRFEAAYRGAEQDGNTNAMVAAVLGLGGLWVHEHRTAAGSEMMQVRLRHALSLVGPRSSAGLRLRVRMAGENDYRAGEHAGILAVLDEARLAGDPLAHVEALRLAHHCVLGPEHGPLRLALAAELIGESALTMRRSDLLMGLLWQTVDLFLDAEPHAQRRLSELQNLLAQRDHRAIGFVVSAIEVMLTIRAGRFDDAEAAARACAIRGAAAGDIDAAGWFGAQLFAIRWYQGRLPELLPMLAELVWSESLSAVDNSYFAALAVAAATAGDRRTAAGALAILYDLASLPRSSSWLVMMSWVVEAAYLLGDADLSARAYRLLHPFAHLPVVASFGVVCFGSVDHALGVASLTTGELDAAVDHLRVAVQRNLALGHWPAVVMSRLCHAQALALRAQSQDTVSARLEYAAAVEEAAALGMPLPADAGRASSRLTVTCTRDGPRWRVRLGRRTAVVEHCVGMGHLAVLTAQPGTEIPAVGLVSGPNLVADGQSAQPMLDPTALRQYRDRLSWLDVHIDELEAGNDLAGAARARAERNWLVADLARATGLGGRTRHFADDAERARIAVSKAIRRALARIAAADPLIGSHLRGTVRTGIRCTYWPA